ncbi:MAG: hypothetical protein KDA45_06585 [Planctomycetales bacterium]|nr:hypothetical protein [Planctomycetales bacterium]
MGTDFDNIFAPDQGRLQDRPEESLQETLLQYVEQPRIRAVFPFESFFSTYNEVGRDSALVKRNTGIRGVEPFTIVCSTCQSRIRVRNANMLGQLANCPKCSSMIMIEPRPRIEVGSPQAEPVDSTAMTKEGLAGELPADGSQPGTAKGQSGQPGLPTAEPTPGEPTPGESILGDSGRGDRGAEASDEYRLADSDPGLGSGSSPRLANGLGAPPPWQADAGPLVPSEQWTSPTSTKSRQILLIGFLGAAGVALSTLLFFGFLRWYTAPGANAAPELAAAAVPSATEDSGDLRSGDMGGAQPPASQAAERRPAESSLAESLPNGLTPDTPALDLPPPETPAGETLPPETPAEGSGDIAAAAQTMDVPPGLAPPDSDDDIPAADGGEALDSAAESPLLAAAEPTMAMPKQMQALLPMLDWKVQPQLPDALEVLSEAPVTAEDLGLDTVDDTLALPPIDWNLHSQTMLPGLVIAARPLSQFVNLWTNLSGVPTVVDLDALAAANVDPRQKIALQMVKSVSIATVAQQLGRPLALMAEPRDNRYLRLAPPADKVQATVPTTVSLQGLVDDEAGRQWLAVALARLFPELPAEWKIEGQALSRPAGVDPLHWFSVLRLLEGWRAASGQPPAVEGYDASRLTAILPDAGEMDSLDQELKEVLPVPRPVAQILPRLGAEAGLHIWIDWPNVAAVGVGPQTTALLVTSARPLRYALADYAEQFSLVVAVEDAHSLWITSPAAYRQQTRLYVIPSQGRTAEQWQQQLRPLTPASSEGVGAVTVISTPDAKFMLVRCCRPTLR